jgi:ribose transport system ATP-binding protein
MKESIFYLHDISLSYGKNTDAHDICLSLNKGEVVSFYGLGVAGHHALTDFLGGSCHLTSGTAVVNQTAITGDMLFPAFEYGIFRIEPFSQPENSLSVLEFLFLVRPEKYILRFWNEKKLIRRTQEIFETVGLHCHVHTKLGEFSPVEYFQLQCAKAVDMHMSVVLFSEDISGFPDADIKKFNKTLSMLKKRGVSAVICSDSLPEELPCSDSVYLFRDGTIVKKLRAEQYDRETALAYVKSADIPFRGTIPGKGIPVFSFSGLTEKEEKKLKFSVYSSEAVNLVDYSFPGREKIFKSLVGEIYNPVLKIQIGRETVRPVKYQTLLKKKVAAVRNFCEENSGFPKLTVEDNMVIPSLKKIRRYGLFVTDKAGKALYRQLKNQYPDFPEHTADCSLAERIIIQMESFLVFGPEVLIMLDPFFQLDANCRNIVSDYIKKFIKRGAAVLLISPGGSVYNEICSRTIQIA